MYKYRNKKKNSYCMNNQRNCWKLSQFDDENKRKKRIKSNHRKKRTKWKSSFHSVCWDIQTPFSAAIHFDELQTIVWRILVFFFSGGNSIMMSKIRCLTLDYSEKGEFEIFKNLISKFWFFYSRTYKFQKQFKLKK